MATSICYSRSIVHFRYPFQKTIANPVLGHGMIKLLKPPRTAGIWVRALPDSSRRELRFNGTEKKVQECWTLRETGRFKCENDIRELLIKCEDDIRELLIKCEDDIRELLSSRIDTDLTKQDAYDLSDKLQHMESHPEEDGGLVYLYRKILTPADISTMWKIAFYNRPNQAADMLPLKNHSRVTWSGKSVNIIHDRKRKRGDEVLQKFPMEGKWEMELRRCGDEELHRCGDGEAYNVVFKGKKGLLHGRPLLPERFLGDKEGAKEGLAFVKKNLNSIPPGVEPFDFAIAFGADGPWRSNNPFVIYMRAAGPNVLIGQAWTENSKIPWAEVVLVKRK